MRSCSKSDYVPASDANVQWNMIKTYPEQLSELAKSAGIDLKDAFAKAGIPTSTYYRSVKGKRHMTCETAARVASAIAELGRQ